MALTAEQKLRKMELKALADMQTQASNERLAMNILNNPALWIILGYVVIEKGQRDGWIADQAGSWAEGGILLAAGAKALAPVADQAIPAAAELGGKVIENINPLTWFKGFFTR